MGISPTNEQITDLLHSAFLAACATGGVDDTLMGAVGKIESHVSDGVLLLASGNGNDFHAVPLDLEVLRKGIADLASR